MIDAQRIADEAQERALGAFRRRRALLIEIQKAEAQLADAQRALAVHDKAHGGN